MAAKIEKKAPSEEILGIAGNIGYYLARYGWSVAYLARKTGFKPQTLQNKQRHPETYTVTDLYDISVALGVSYADIACGKKPKHKWD